MKRVVFIGQAPARPGSKHGQPGSYVRSWLYSIGLTEAAIAENFRFYALVANFPGSDVAGHLLPTPLQMLAHQPFLIQSIQAFQPDILVPVGSMAIAAVLPMAPPKLSDTIGKSYLVNPFNCLPESILAIPLPHPSGRSTWLSQHLALLTQALQLIKQAL